ncbi:MAG: sugar-binding transcriptional regulator [Anaerolineales bacterium]|nr:sugar-binding transcriptional regulator [Anaerolineales bacterium]
MTNENQRVALKAAQLYYENGLTQDEVAQKLRLSRPKVSRLLQEARDAGLVKITVASPAGSHTALERQLEQRYNLLDVLIVELNNPDSYEHTARELGAAAAGYFRRIVQDGDTIGLTWGLTLASMIDNLAPEKKKNVTVAQLTGGIGEPGAETHATDLVRRLAMTLDANLQLLPAPGIVKTVELAHMLRSEPYIAQALEQMSRVNLAFVGIGALNRDSLMMRDERIITWKEVQPLVDRGAVGDIGLHIYDVHGRVLSSEIEERLVGASIETYRDIARVVGVAGGTGKYFSILGGVRGRWINTLITDVGTATRLLAEPV